jgi:hypothetical protein
LAFAVTARVGEGLISCTRADNCMVTGTPVGIQSLNVADYFAIE